MGVFRVPYTPVTISMVCLPYMLFLVRYGLEFDAPGKVPGAPVKCFRDPNMTDPPDPIPVPLKPWSYAGLLPRVNWDHPTPGPLHLIGPYPGFETNGRKKRSENPELPPLAETREEEERPVNSLWEPRVGKLRQNYQQEEQHQAVEGSGGSEEEEVIPIPYDEAEAEIIRQLFEEYREWEVVPCGNTTYRS